MRTPSRRPGPADRVRVGRAERETCVDELQEHYAAGRLDEQELSESVGAALTATTRADLDVLFIDLPSPRARVTGRTHRGGLLVGFCGALIAGALGLGAVGLASGVQSEPFVESSETVCASTGEATGPDNPCPVVSAVQQQILADADAADRAAQQLQDIADRSPDTDLSGLLEQAWAYSGRARDAAEQSRQIVLTADGEPSEKVLAESAAAARRAVESTQQTLDTAVDRLDR